jgi:hypothetical protein
MGEGPLERHGGKAVGEAVAEGELEQPHQRVDRDEAEHHVGREVSTGALVAERDDHGAS